MNRSIVERPNFWISILLIAIGVIFLLDNLNIVYFGDLWDYWPLIFVAVGFAKLLDSKFKDWVSAGVLMLIGFGLLLLSLNYLDWGDIWMFWPVVLIYIGVRILLRNTDRKARDVPELSENRIDTAALFGGKEVRLTTSAFEGGSVTTMFGGTEIYLTHSQLAPGKNILDVFVMFGGVEIHVPEDWRVITRGFPIFGGFENKTRSLPSEDPLQAESVLIVKGIVAFGGIEIKNV